MRCVSRWQDVIADDCQPQAQRVNTALEQDQSAGGPCQHREDRLPAAQCGDPAEHSDETGVAYGIQEVRQLPVVVCDLGGADTVEDGIQIGEQQVDEQSGQNRRCKTGESGGIEP